MTAKEVKQILVNLIEEAHAAGIRILYTNDEGQYEDLLYVYCTEDEEHINTLY